MIHGNQAGGNRASVTPATPAHLTGLLEKKAMRYWLLSLVLLSGCAGFATRVDEAVTRPAEDTPSQVEELIEATAPALPSPWREFLLFGVGSIAGWYGEKRRRERGAA